ncbi:hypothetical protein AS156_15155 [Bradyrhizobium macuxiense]|uniref:Tim44-like domain-containing protein n=2 Tax=Bradyrhizobium macuxiense TaxID=1755647 RepID=A0A120FK00_9BRAD|nr:hypothetical protein AS156_15155 [Bradyrhizobium macuxiense]
MEALAASVLKHCGGLTVIDFLSERLAAYEAVVAAFNAGDQATLLRYVSPEVYAEFSDAISAQEDRHEKTKTVFALVAPPEIVAARFDDAHAEISVRFVASSYRILEGGEGKPEERRSVDVWTFGCAPPTHRWSLIATEAGR